MRGRFSPTLLIALAALLGAGLQVNAQEGAQKRALTVYTYESFISEWGPGPKVKAAFEAECACTLNFVGLTDGVALLTRLKLEGGHSSADVVLGLDTNLIAEAEDTGFFEPHGIDTAAITVPGGFSDKIFVPYDYSHFAVIYDSDTVKTPPKSLKELVDGDPAEKIAIQDPRTSTPGLGLLLWVKSVYGDEAPQAWRKLKARILTVTPGWSEAYGLFTRGEVPLVLSYTTSPAYHLIEEKSDRYRAAAFAEGHYLQIEVAGLLKTARDRELARKFLQFTTSPAFQDIIPTTNWMWPAAPTSTPLPEAFAALPRPETSLLFSPREVADNRRAWIDEWLTALGTR